MKADSAPATVQAKVEVRRTHTPDSRAESAFSDMARMASPHEREPDRQDQGRR